MDSALWQARDVWNARRPSRAYTFAALSTRGLHPWLFTDVPPGLENGTFDTNRREPRPPRRERASACRHKSEPLFVYRRVIFWKREDAGDEGPVCSLEAA